MQNILYIHVRRTVYTTYVYCIYSIQCIQCIQCILYTVYGIYCIHYIVYTAVYGILHIQHTAYKFICKATVVSNCIYLHAFRLHRHRRKRNECWCGRNEKWDASELFEIRRNGALQGRSCLIVFICSRLLGQKFR